jgi:AcrR family transcriptional regulator
LNAAHRLFAEQGYQRTTMPEIAQAAGVALDTVYDSVGKKPDAVFIAESGGFESSVDPLQVRRLLRCELGLTEPPRNRRGSAA